MTDRPDGRGSEGADGQESEGADGQESEGADGWPVDLRGVTESVVTTLGPNERWNVAALGLHAAPRAAERASGPDGSRAAGDPVTARTWGNTRTRRNFHREGGGVVQFVRDPVLFVRAALEIHEVEEPVLDEAMAWVEVEAEQVDAGETDGTRWEEWTLVPVDSAVDRRVVPTVNRGFNAVVEATVAASRLGVAGFDDEVLRARLDYFEDVVARCGGEREREAMTQLSTLADTDRAENESF